jgi:agmatinase
VALPLLRAMAARHGPVAVVHFDAHLDTWDTYFGAAYTHGTPFRRAAEEGLLDPMGCVHVGIRGPLYTADDLGQDASLGFQVVPSTEVDAIGRERRDRADRGPGRGPPGVRVRRHRRARPGLRPGTGTPEAGGLSSRELLAIVRSLGAVNLVGADIVEVAPAYDHAEITGIAAAHVGYELLSAMAPKHEWGGR